jgi:protein-disulfide isomerase
VKVSRAAGHRATSVANLGIQAIEQVRRQERHVGGDREKELAVALGREPKRGDKTSQWTGDVSIVEFFDYNCGYCKRALPDVLKAVNDDGKIRLEIIRPPTYPLKLATMRELNRR